MKTMSNRKSRNNKLFDIDKSTKTFMTLMTKYRNQKRKTKDKDNNFVIREIDDKRYKLEIEEKDNMYIYKEAKNLAYINQELINRYGAKAKSQTYDISKFQVPIKLGKNTFFDPTKENIEKSNSSLKIIKKGIIKLPLISQNLTKYNKKPLLTYNNSNCIKNKNEDFKNIKMITDYSLDNNKKYDIPINNNNEPNNGTEKNGLLFSLFSKSENNLLIDENKKNKNIKKVKRNSFRNKNNKYCSNIGLLDFNGNYVTKLSKFKDKLIKEEREKRNYFDRNDYGYNLFMEKYDFLNKKYFYLDEY